MQSTAKNLSRPHEAETRKFTKKYTNLKRGFQRFLAGVLSGTGERAASCWINPAQTFYTHSWGAIK